MNRAAGILLKVSLAFAFLYPPINAWFDPFSWIGYIPPFIYMFWPWSHLVFLHLFGVAEISLALWLLSGYRPWIPSALMALMLLVIVATNVNQMDVVFRDLSLAGLAIALTLRHWPQSPRVVA